MITRGSDFADRPQNFTTARIITDYKDITFQNYTDQLKRHRKILQTAMRANGTKGWQKLISKEIDKFLESLSRKAGTLFDIDHSLTVTSFNVVCDMVIGRTFTENDMEFNNFQDATREVTMCLLATNVVAYYDYVPWVKVFMRSKLQYMKDVSDRRYRFLESELEHHIATFDREKPRDMIDMILIEREDSDMKADDMYSNAHIIQSLIDLLSAGVETAISATKWLLIELIHHPDIQAKIHQELDEVIGGDRLPVYSDRQNLPYVEAAIYEALRIHSTVPLGVFRCTARDTSLGGHDIPTNTIVIPNHWAIDHDEKVFEDPYSFNPQRFIDPKTGLLVSYNNMNFAPFSMGRRVCLGEVFGRMKYFLIVSNILHQFEFVVPPGVEKPSREGILGLTYHPKPFEVMVKKRK
ncbi:steroid 17-alpha-hydroxylase/17,20 lyase-like [Saccoglossus kowalevskii]